MRETSGPAAVPRRRVLSRRKLLQSGAAAALLFGGSLVALARTSGYIVPGRGPLQAFSPWQFTVFQHAARRIAAPDRAGDPGIPRPDDLGVAEFADGWVSRMPAPTRRDLGRFLAYVEHIAPLAAGHVHRFTSLAAAEQDQVLASLESSYNDLLRAGFEGVKSLVFLGYYRDPRTWGLLGYDGPWVGRPARGWR